MTGQQRGKIVFAFPWLCGRGEGAASNLGAASLGRERGSVGTADAGRGRVLLVLSGTERGEVEQLRGGCGNVQG